VTFFSVNLRLQFPFNNNNNNNKIIIIIIFAHWTGDSTCDEEVKNNFHILDFGDLLELIFELAQAFKHDAVKLSPQYHQQFKS